MSKTKTAAQLQREIDATLSIGPMMPKWRKGVAAYHKAIAVLRAGGDTSGDDVRRARERLYKLIHEAAQHAPLSYGDPAVEKLNAEMASLPSIADAREAGRVAREKMYREQSAKLREQEREAEWNSPTYWMRK